MINIVLSILPVVWLGSMTTAGLELREQLYENLVKYLEKLEVSLPQEQILKRDKSKDPLDTVTILKKDKKDKNLRSSLVRKQGVSPRSLVSSVKS